METIVTCVIGGFVICGVLFDVEFNKESQDLHSRPFRWRRMLNWLPLGVAYAAFYMARYNIAAGNIDSVRKELNMTSTDIGWIISSGSWAYAFTAPWTGQWADRLGGQKGVLLACVGASICNLLLGMVFTNSLGSRLVVMILFALNVAVQGFGTSGAMKVIGAWYGPSERGVFSGVFNIFVASGYYLALGSGHSIISSIGWPFLFYIPSILLVGMAIVIYLFVRNSPQTLVSHVPSTAKKAPVNILKLLQNRTLLGYLAAVFCLSWARDGFLNWMYSFFDGVRSTPLSEDDHAVLGGAWTIGGFVGGILCGWISDKFFKSQRMPAIVLFSGLQSVCFVFLYLFAPTLSIELLSLLVFAVSVFLLGNYTLLNYAVPTDLPPDVCASATGLLTAVGYISTGLAGIVMGTCIENYGYTFWVVSLTITSLATGVCAKIGSCYEVHASSESIPLQHIHSQQRSRASSVVGVDMVFMDVDLECPHHTPVIAVESESHETEFV